MHVLAKIRIKVTGVTDIYFIGEPTPLACAPRRSDMVSRHPHMCSSLAYTLVLKHTCTLCTPQADMHRVTDQPEEDLFGPLCFFHWMKHSNSKTHHLWGNKLNPQISVDAFQECGTVHIFFKKNPSIQKMPCVFWGSKKAIHKRGPDCWCLWSQRRAYV